MEFFPSFFKPLSKYSQDHFYIPCDFAQKYLEGGSDGIQKVVLKAVESVGNKEWTVQYLKIVDGYVFVNGWSKLVKDNGLQSTDRIVFWLTSPPPEAIFNVVFFSPNGAESSDERLTSHEGGAFFIEILPNDLHSSYLLLPSKPFTTWLEMNSTETQKVLLRTGSGDGDERPVNYLQINNKFYFMDGWSQFINENGLKKGDCIVFSLLRGPPTALFLVYLYSTHGCLKQSTSRSCHIRPEGVPNVDNSSNVVNETCTDSHPSEKKMLFEKDISKTTADNMPLTKDFEKVTGIKCTKGKKVRVKNDEGKFFDIGTAHWRSVPNLTKGWSEFLKASNIEPGDTCIFYYLKDENMLHVHLKKKGGSEDVTQRKRGRPSFVHLKKEGGSEKVTQRKRGRHQKRGRS